MVEEELVEEVVEAEGGSPVLEQGRVLERELGEVWVKEAGRDWERAKVGVLEQEDSQGLE